jgi:hypothetical protein
MGINSKAETYSFSIGSSISFLMRGRVTKSMDVITLTSSSDTSIGKVGRGIVQPTAEERGKPFY